MAKTSPSDYRQRAHEFSAYLFLFASEEADLLSWLGGCEEKLAAAQAVAEMVLAAQPYAPRDAPRDSAVQRAAVTLLIRKPVR